MGTDSATGGTSVTTPALLREDGADVRLVAARCSQCEWTSFPIGRGCQRCGSTELVSATLGPRGTLWAATVDRLGALNGEPTGVAWVRFSEGPIVQGYLQGDIDDQPSSGTTVKLVTYELPAGSAAGATTYAFSTIEGRS